MSLLDPKYAFGIGEENKRYREARDAVDDDSDDDEEDDSEDDEAGDDDVLMCNTCASAHRRTAETLPNDEYEYACESCDRMFSYDASMHNCECDEPSRVCKPCYRKDYTGMSIQELKNIAAYATKSNEADLLEFVKQFHTGHTGHKKTWIEALKGHWEENESTPKAPKTKQAIAATDAESDVKGQFETIFGSYNHWLGNRETLGDDSRGFEGKWLREAPFTELDKIFEKYPDEKSNLFDILYDEYGNKGITWASLQRKRQTQKWGDKLGQLVDGGIGNCEVDPYDRGRDFLHWNEVDATDPTVKAAQSVRIIAALTGILHRINTTTDDKKKEAKKWLKGISDEAVKVLLSLAEQTFSNDSMEVINLEEDPAEAVGEDEGAAVAEAEVQTVVGIDSDGNKLLTGSRIVMVKTAWVNSLGVVLGKGKSKGLVDIKLDGEESKQDRKGTSVKLVAAGSDDIVVALNEDDGVNAINVKATTAEANLRITADELATKEEALNALLNEAMADSDPGQKDKQTQITERQTVVNDLKKQASAQKDAAKTLWEERNREAHGSNTRVLQVKYDTALAACIKLFEKEPQSGDFMTSSQAWKRAANTRNEALQDTEAEYYRLIQHIKATRPFSILQRPITREKVRSVLDALSSLTYATFISKTYKHGENDFSFGEIADDGTHPVENECFYNALGVVLVLTHGDAPDSLQDRFNEVYTRIEVELKCPSNWGNWIRFEFIKAAYALAESSKAMDLEDYWDILILETLSPTAVFAHFEQRMQTATNQPAESGQQASLRSPVLLNIRPDTLPDSEEKLGSDMFALSTSGVIVNVKTYASVLSLRTDFGSRNADEAAIKGLKSTTPRINVATKMVRVWHTNWQPSGGKKEEDATPASSTLLDYTLSSIQGVKKAAQRWKYGRQLDATSHFDWINDLKTDTSFTLEGQFTFFPNNEQWGSPLPPFPCCWVGSRIMVPKYIGFELEDVLVVQKDGEPGVVKFEVDQKHNNGMIHFRPGTEILFVDGANEQASQITELSSLSINVGLKKKISSDAQIYSNHEQRYQPPEQYFNTLTLTINKNGKDVTGFQIKDANMVDCLKQYEKFRTRPETTSRNEENAKCVLCKTVIGDRQIRHTYTSGDCLCDDCLLRMPPVGVSEGDIPINTVFNHKWKVRYGELDFGPAKIGPRKRGAGWMDHVRAVTLNSAATREPSWNNATEVIFVRVERLRKSRMNTPNVDYRNPTTVKPYATTWKKKSTPEQHEATHNEGFDGKRRRDARGERGPKQPSESEPQSVHNDANFDAAFQLLTRVNNLTSVPNEAPFKRAYDALAAMVRGDPDPRQLARAVANLKRLVDEFTSQQPLPRAYPSAIVRGGVRLPRSLEITVKEGDAVLLGVACLRFIRARLPHAKVVGIGDVLARPTFDMSRGIWTNADFAAILYGANPKVEEDPAIFCATRPWLDNKDTYVLRCIGKAHNGVILARLQMQGMTINMGTVDALKEVVKEGAKDMTDIKYWGAKLQGVLNGTAIAASRVHSGITDIYANWEATKGLFENLKKFVTGAASTVHDNLSNDGNAGYIDLISYWIMSASGWGPTYAALAAGRKVWNWYARAIGKAIDAKMDKPEVWYIPAHVTIDQFLDLCTRVARPETGPPSVAERTQFIDSYGKIKANTITLFHVWYKDQKEYDEKNNLQLPPHGLLIFKLGRQSLPPALLAEYTFKTYNEGRSSGHSLSHATGRIEVSLNLNTVVYTTQKALVNQIEINELIPGKIPARWSLNAYPVMETNMTLTTLEDRIGKVVDSSAWASKLTEETLAVLLPATQPVVGTMTPATKGYVYAFGLILRAFADAPQLSSQHGLRRSLKMHAVDLRETNFNDAWTAWENAVKATTTFAAQANFTMDGGGGVTMANATLNASRNEMVIEAVIEAAQTFVGGSRDYLFSLLGDNASFAAVNASLTPPPGDQPEPAAWAQDTIDSCTNFITSDTSYFGDIHEYLTRLAVLISEVITLLFPGTYYAGRMEQHVQEFFDTKLSIAQAMGIQSVAYIGLFVLVAALIGSTTKASVPWLNKFVDDALDNMEIPAKFNGRFVQVVTGERDLTTHALFYPTDIGLTNNKKACIFIPVLPEDDKKTKDAKFNCALCIVPAAHGVYPLWAGVNDLQIAPLLEWIRRTRWRMVNEDEELKKYQYSYNLKQTITRGTKANNIWKRDANVEVMFFGPAGGLEMVNSNNKSIHAIESHTRAPTHGEATIHLGGGKKDASKRAPGIYSERELIEYAPDFNKMAELRVVNYGNVMTDATAMKELALRLYDMGLQVARSGSQMVLRCRWGDIINVQRADRERTLRFDATGGDVFELIGCSKADFMAWARKHTTLQVVNDWLLHDSGTLRHSRSDMYIVGGTPKWRLLTRTSVPGIYVGQTLTLMRITAGVFMGGMSGVSALDAAGATFKASNAFVNPGLSPAEIQESISEQTVGRQLTLATLEEAATKQIDGKITQAAYTPVANPDLPDVSLFDQTATSDDASIAYHAINHGKHPELDLKYKPASPSTSNTFHDFPFTLFPAIVAEMGKLPPGIIPKLLDYGIKHAFQVRQHEPETGGCWITIKQENVTDAFRADTTQQFPVAKDGEVQILAKESETAVAALGITVHEKCWDPWNLINTTQAMMVLQQRDFGSQLETIHRSSIESGTMSQTLSDALTIEMIQINATLSTAVEMGRQPLSEQERTRLSALAVLKMELVRKNVSDVIALKPAKADLRRMRPPIVEYVNKCIIGMTIDAGTGNVTYTLNRKDPFYFAWADTFAKTVNARKPHDVAEWEECMLLQIGTDAHTARNLDLLYTAHANATNHASGSLLEAYATMNDFENVEEINAWSTGRTAATEAAVGHLTTDTRITTQLSEFFLAFSAGEYVPERNALYLSDRLKKHPDWYLLLLGHFFTNTRKYWKIQSLKTVEDKVQWVIGEMAAKFKLPHQLAKVDMAFPTVLALAKLSVAINGTWAERWRTALNTGDNAAELMSGYYNRAQTHLRAITAKEDPDAYALLHGPNDTLEDTVKKINITAVLSAYSYVQKEVQVTHEWHEWVAERRAAFNLVQMGMYAGDSVTLRGFLVGGFQLSGGVVGAGKESTLAFARSLKYLNFLQPITNQMGVELSEGTDATLEELEPIRKWGQGLDQLNRGWQLVDTAMTTTFKWTKLDAENMTITWLLAESHWRHNQKSLSAVFAGQFAAQMWARLMLEALASKYIVKVARVLYEGIFLAAMDHGRTITANALLEQAAKAEARTNEAAKVIRDVIHGAAERVAGKEIVSAFAWGLRATQEASDSTLGPLLKALTGRKDAFQLVQTMNEIQKLREADTLVRAVGVQLSLLEQFENMNATERAALGEVAAKKTVPETALEAHKGV
jgi:hypothetical protein